MKMRMRMKMKMKMRMRIREDEASGSRCCPVHPLPCGFVCGRVWRKEGKERGGKRKEERGRKREEKGDVCAKRVNGAEHKHPQPGVHAACGRGRYGSGRLPSACVIKEQNWATTPLPFASTRGASHNDTDTTHRLHITHAVYTLHTHRLLHRPHSAAPPCSTQQPSAQQPVQHTAHSTRAHEHMNTRAQGR